MKPNITSLLDNMVARGSALRSRSCEIEFGSKLLPKLKSFLVVVYFIVFTFITYKGLEVLELHKYVSELCKLWTSQVAEA